jgi:DNA invertase Pin-like site-specific DNA recombinase
MESPCDLAYRRKNSSGHLRAWRQSLKAAGCTKIYSEKASGKSTNGRPELAKVMKVLKPGDAVVVTKLDRIARSSRDLHNILGNLKELGCGFVSLGEGWCDTTTSVGRLVISPASRSSSAS